MKQLITLSVNGADHEIAAHHHSTLLEVLREELGLTGTKEGCGLGGCGACTVLVDGQPVLSCITLACSVQGKRIQTVEGMADDGTLSPLQQAFVEAGAVQCGFCTPGMLLSAQALLARTPHPDKQEIRTALSGNLCRCTGYEQIIRAVQEAAKIRK